ncbi:unnamed protein product [Schistosoma margrebowiei]|uniref:Uncharacterized protein n=1 Tax=Schistosoma margrebowiei TaxID=48269 RepID=A0A183LG04_9TREM|nr:unnamed protein product [Schistosoma margrebowiei]
MYPVMGFWEKLRMKLDRVSSTQTSTSENHKTETNTTTPNCTTTHSTNPVPTPVTVNVYDMVREIYLLILIFIIPSSVVLWLYYLSVQSTEKVIILF